MEGTPPPGPRHACSARASADSAAFSLPARRSVRTAASHSSCECVGGGGGQGYIQLFYCCICTADPAPAPPLTSFLGFFSRPCSSRARALGTLPAPSSSRAADSHIGTLLMQRSNPLLYEYEERRRAVIREGGTLCMCASAQQPAPVYMEDEGGMRRAIRRVRLPYAVASNPPQQAPPSILPSFLPYHLPSACTQATRAASLCTPPPPSVSPPPVHCSSRFGVPALLLQLAQHEVELGVRGEAADALVKQGTFLKVWIKVWIKCGGWG